MFALTLSPSSNSFTPRNDYDSRPKLSKPACSNPFTQWNHLPTPYAQYISSPRAPTRCLRTPKRVPQSYKRILRPVHRKSVQLHIYIIHMYTHIQSVSFKSTRISAKLMFRIKNFQEDKIKRNHLIIDVCKEQKLYTFDYLNNRVKYIIYLLDLTYPLYF